jgi:hypothetical protein
VLPHSFEQHSTKQLGVALHLKQSGQDLLPYEEVKAIFKEKLNELDD